MFFTDEVEMFQVFVVKRWREREEEKINMEILNECHEIDRDLCVLYLCRACLFIRPNAAN